MAREEVMASWDLAIHEAVQGYAESFHFLLKWDNTIAMIPFVAPQSVQKFHLYSVQALLFHLYQHAIVGMLEDTGESSSEMVWPITWRLLAVI